MVDDCALPVVALLGGCGGGDVLRAPGGTVVDCVDGDVTEVTAIDGAFGACAGAGGDDGADEFCKKKKQKISL